MRALGALLLMLAEAASRNGRLSAAFLLYLRWLEIQGDLYGTLPAIDSIFARVLSRVSGLAVQFGCAGPADLLLRGLADSHRVAGRFIDADIITLDRIHLAGTRCDENAVFELFAEMRPSLGDIFEGDGIPSTSVGLMLWEQHRHWPGAGDRSGFFARFYLELGRLAERQGFFALAFTAFRRGLTHTASSPTARACEIPIRLEIAAAGLYAGDFGATKSELARTRQVSRIAQLPYFVRRLEISIEHRMLTGGFGDCLNDLRNLVEILENAGLEQAALVARMNLARCLIFLMQTEAARTELSGVLQRAHSIGETGLEEAARILAQRADDALQRISQAAPPSIAAMRQEIKLFEAISRISEGAGRGVAFVTYFSDRCAAFSRLIHSNDTPAAQTELENIRQRFGATDSRLVRVRLALLEGVLALAENKPDKAARLTSACLPELRALGLKPELAYALSVAGVDSSSMVDESISLVDEMANALGTLNDSIIYPTGQADLVDRWLTCRLKGLLTAQAHGGSKKVVWEQLEPILDRLYNHRERLRQRDGWRHFHRRQPKTNPWTGVKGRATIAFVVLPDRVFTVAVSGGWFRVSAAPVTRSQVRHLIVDWHGAVAEVERLGPRSPKRDGLKNPEQQRIELTAWEKSVGGALAEAAAKFDEVVDTLNLACLFEDLLEDPPQQVSELVILPDDVLHAFPFAAVKVKSRYLIEHLPVSIGYQPAEPRKISPDAHPPGPCLLAGVQHGTPEYRMPSVVNNLKWLAEIFPGASQLPANEVTIQNLMTLLPDAGLFHIACHGEFDATHPERSGFVLVQPEAEVQVMSLNHLASLTLPNLHHATLTACSSADHYYTSGRWALGMGESLIRAGAHSVLAPIWPVSNLEANEFLRMFYGLLKTLPRNAALRETQRHFRDKPLTFWAGWQLYGAPDPLPQAFFHPPSSAAADSEPK